MFIMTGSVVFLAISFLLFTRSIVEKSQEEELKKAEGRIFEKMEQYDHDDSVTPKFGGPLGSNLEIPYYLTYIVYDSDSYTLLATNDPFLPFLPNTNKKARHYFQKDYFFDGDLDILYYAEPHTNNKNHNIIIAVVLNIDNNQASALFPATTNTSLRTSQKERECGGKSHLHFASYLAVYKKSFLCKSRYTKKGILKRRSN